jgi:predicted nucleotide-binding protein
MARPPKIGVVQAKLSPAEMLEGIDRLKKRLAELQAFDFANMPEPNPPSLAALEASIARSLEKTFGVATTDLARYSSATYLQYHAIAMDGYDLPLQTYRRETGEKIRSAIALLEQAIQALEEDYGEVSAKQPAPTPTVGAASSQSLKRKVFVVHGHDNEAKEAVARFLQGIGFEVVILHEQANQGRTVIEKVEAHSDVGFAVVLLTPDDVGKGRNEASLRDRARQNVILELGYFVGKLGRKHVCAIRRGDIEIPSDFGGVVYETFDDKGAWKIALGKELQAAGHRIQWDSIMGA